MLIEFQEWVIYMLAKHYLQQEFTPKELREKLALLNGLLSYQFFATSYKKALPREAQLLEIFTVLTEVKVTINLVSLFMEKKINPALCALNLSEELFSQHDPRFTVRPVRSFKITPYCFNLPTALKYVFLFKEN